MEYFISLAVLVGIYITLSSSFNLIIGFGGLVSIAHPIFFAFGAYTTGLLDALPERNLGRRRMAMIPGTVASLTPPPLGCRFASRCAHAQDRCRREPPVMVDTGRSRARCHFPHVRAGDA